MRWSIDNSFERKLRLAGTDAEKPQASEQRFVLAHLTLLLFVKSKS
jgi:hypothetical protein